MHSPSEVRPAVLKPSRKWALSVIPFAFTFSRVFQAQEYFLQYQYRYPLHFELYYLFSESLYIPF